jgi:hypothetical protein
MSRLIIEEPERQGDEVRWVGRFESETKKSFEIYFHFDVPAGTEFLATERPFLLVFLLPAMSLGEPLEIAGGLDEITRRNLYEWQRAFADAVPKLKVVEILEEGEPVTLPERKGALCAFSGGVDSCFTALRGSESEVGPVPAICGALMVHGFDIKLENEEGFARAFARSEKLLAESGIRLFKMRTNARDVLDSLNFSWGSLAHGIVLAAALSCYESFFKEIVIPSTFSYQSIKFPWGSGQATDHLFASRETDWWHEGATYNKLGKILAIADNESVRRYLRVCWEGSEVDQNCGHCFKCIATQVCFWISGCASLECFPSPCKMREVAWVPLRNSSNRKLFPVLAKAAQERGLDGLANACWAAPRRQWLLKVKKEIFRPFC